MSLALLNKLQDSSHNLTQVVLVNFSKFLRTDFLQNTSGRLFLSYLLYVLQLVIEGPPFKRCLFVDT